MAATIKGFTDNEIKVQPALVINSMENGGWTASHTMIFRAEDFDTCAPQFDEGVLLSELDENIPPPFDEFLRITTVSIARIEGDLYEVSLNASGSGSNQFQNGGDLSEDAEPTYTLNGQLVEVDILQHPKALKIRDESLNGLRPLLTLKDNPDEIFFDWREPNVYILSDLDKSRYPIPVPPDQDYSIYISPGDETEFGKRIALGQTTYFKCVYTWTETTEGKEPLTPEQLNKLGMISEPRGNPPMPSGNRQWMLTNVSQSEYGELYRTSIEWTLSEEGGYNEFLYDE